MKLMPNEYIIPLEKVEKEDMSNVGLKGANIGEILKAGFPVPPGFVVSAQAYFDFIKLNKIDLKITHLLNMVNTNDPNSVNQTRQLIRKYIFEAEIPNQTTLNIYKSYKKLSRYKDPFVAVRSSVVNENLEFKNYVLNDSFLNIKGDTNVILKVKECWAMYISSSITNKLDPDKNRYLKEGLGIIIQVMSESKKSGLIYTIDTQNHDKSKLLITAIYGLGNYLIYPESKPDIYSIDKNDLSIVSKTINTQNKMIKKVGNNDKLVRVFPFSKNKQKLSDDEITSLAKLALKIEKHYYFPQIIEWSIEKNFVYVLEIKPLNTVLEQTQTASGSNPNSSPKIILKGKGIHPGIHSGHVRIVTNTSDIHKLQSGEIIVIEDYCNQEPSILRKAGAYIQNLDLKKQHVMFFKKEIGIPVIVNTKTGTKTLKDQSVITINANTGEIFSGTPHLLNISFST